MRVQGLYVPLLTPMTADGGLDLAAMGGHVERLLAAGVDGFVVLGTTGEFADLTGPERAGVISSAVQAVDGRAPVLAGVGAVGTSEACAHARAAVDLGVQGVLALAPLYWKLDGEGLLRHFAAVAAATPLPVLLYDFPSLSGTPLTPPIIDRIARELPDVIGVKLSGPEVRVAHGVVDRVKAHRPDFGVMIGNADLILAGMLAGADGTIAALANVAPETFAALVAAVRDDDAAEAVRQHRRVLELQAIPALSSPPILALKAAAGACGSPIGPHVRTPPAGAADAPARAAELASRLLSRSSAR